MCDMDRARKRAQPRPIPPPPKSHRRTLAQIREWYNEFSHRARDEIIDKESRIQITNNDPARWDGRWDSERGYFEGEGWLEYGHIDYKVVYSNHFQYKVTKHVCHH